jgi:photosystem II stability/assembly factor-like uncharacterized protein
VYRFTGFVGNDRYWVKVNTGLSNLKITSLVAVDSSTVLAGTIGGVFKTINKGGNWNAINNGIHHNFEIAGLAKAGNRIVHISKGGVFASDDNGASWIAFNDASTNDIEVTKLSYNTRSDAVLILNRNGLYVANEASTTAAPSFSLAEKGLPGGIKINAISNDGLGWYLATNAGVYYSSTGDINWKPYNFNLPQYNITTVSLLNGNIVCGTSSEGIYKNNLHPMLAIDPEPVRTWTSVNSGFNNLKTYALATAGDKIIVTANEKGVFVSKDLATSYVRANNGLTDSLNVTDLVFAENYLYASTQNSGVFISADTGKTWQNVTGGSLLLNIKNLYYSSGTVYCIDNNGSVLKASLNSNAWSIVYSYAHKASSLLILDSKLYVTSLGGGIWCNVPENGFNLRNTGLTNFNVTSITHSNGKLFVGTAGSGVFVSDTASISWTPAATLSISHTTMIGLDGSHVQAMSSNLGYVFASYKGGVLTTSDNGTTWIAGGNQFNLPSYADVHKICFTSGTAGRVFVTTPNNSIYSNALSELPALTTGLFDSFAAKNNSGIRVSPNPNSGTFSLNMDEKVESVEVVNFAGQTVEQLPSLSNQSVTLEATKGIYLVRAKTANGVLVQKIVVE